MTPREMETINRIGRTHLSGYLEGTAWSYPTEINVPSLMRVIIIKNITGREKKAGQSAWSGAFAL